MPKIVVVAIMVGVLSETDGFRNGLMLRRRGGNCQMCCAQLGSERSQPALSAKNTEDEPSGEKEEACDRMGG
jgi:hypothetical protein